MSNQNASEMRTMVRDFIYKTELFSKKDPRANKWLRRVQIQTVHAP